MSSGSAPNCGFVLEASEENLEYLGWDKEKLANLCKDYGVKEKDTETLEDCLYYLSMENVEITLIHDAMELKADVIRYDRENGDIYDELEDGYYLSFDEDDLYERKLSPLGKSMEESKLLPEFKQWTNYG